MSGVSSWWRAATYALLIVLATTVTTTISMFEQFKAQIGHLQEKLKAKPQVHFIAVLLDAKQAPAMLVTLDPAEGALQVQRLNDVKEGREDTMQLWALGPPGTPGSTAALAAPVSLGVLPSRTKTVQLPIQAQTLQGVNTLAISVENRGGVAQSQGPRLPYLFQGAWVQKAL